VRPAPWLLFTSGDKLTVDDILNDGGNTAGILGHNMARI